MSRNCNYRMTNRNSDPVFWSIVKPIHAWNSFFAGLSQAEYYLVIGIAILLTLIVGIKFFESLEHKKKYCRPSR